ncbi:CvpA family protein [Spartinivicinus ruber]|uniref:CvpA family protein n=1 Tax=Spartinivicinus ruber TaxID=2683272 RepID=UPI0013D86C7B|nr:CvpA family protein [Spartinivicinus ruber]
MSLIWVDWLIIGIITISSLLSIRRGFFQEAISMLAWLAAIIVAWVFGGSLSLLFVDYIATTSVRVVLACIVLFLATLLLGAIVSKLFGELVKATGFTGTDRFLGMILGAGRGALCVVLLVGVASLLPVQKDNWWQQSQLIPYFLTVADWSRHHLMELIAPYINSKTQ